MDTAQIEQLGLRVEQGPAGVLATLDLGENSTLVNPITQKAIQSVTFLVSGDRLVPTAPPAMVGLVPVLLNSVGKAADISLLISSAFDDYLFHIERRSAQLHTMGLHPHLDPETLELSTELEAGTLSLTLAADRLGQFRVSQVRRDGHEVSGLPAYRFELFEFREREALANYLSTLIEERLARPQPAASTAGWLVRYEDVARAFGPQGMVPPRSALEVLVQLRVNGEFYRFAAARVQGRTFRGLLAGAKGKVWAERFELENFPGIVPLVADLLKVPAQAVELIGPDTPQE